MAQQMGVPNDYSLELEQIARRRRMAELLQQQAGEPMQQQMAGGFVVPHSPLAGLAKVLQGYTAKKTLDETDAQAKALGNKYNEQRSADFGALVSALQGREAMPAQDMGTDPLTGQAMGRPEIPAIAPGSLNPAILSALKTPEAMQMGQQMLMQQLTRENKPLIFKPGETAVHPTTFKPLYSAPEPQKYHAVAPGSSLVAEPPRGVPGVPAPGAVPGAVFTAPQKEEKNEAQKLTDVLVNAGIDPESPEARGLFKQLAAKIASHQPPASQNVQVNTEKGYFGNIAEGVAKQDLAVIDAGRSAPDRVESARRVKELLKQNPITGTGAEARLSLNKALATAGIIDGSQVRATENLASNLASSTLDAIKTSGLGSGQGFTDKDRQFLERAKSGNLEVNAATLRDLADLNERAAKASIVRANEVIKRIGAAPQMGAVSGQIAPIAEPPAGGLNLSPQAREFLEKAKRSQGVK